MQSGAGYTTNSVAAKGHSYAETVVTATCTENGYTLHKSSGCGDEYDTSIPAMGHSCGRLPEIYPNICTA